MAQIAKAKKNKTQKPDDTVVMMANLIKTAIHTTKLMAALKGNFGDLYSAILVATSEYIVDEAERLGEKPEKFLDYFTTNMKKCVEEIVKDMEKMKQEVDKNTN